MDSLVTYALKSGISLTVFYLYYWLFLQKDTHFRTNRIFLLLSIIISMILPAIAPLFAGAPAALDNLPGVSIDFGLPVASISRGANEPAPAFFKYMNILLIIYITGSLLVFVRLIYQAVFLHAVARLSKKTNHKGFTIISMSADLVPFSYFNRIFIPASRIDEGSFDSIIAHEKSHLSQGHYIDLFIIEIISIFHWFNPVIWFYEKSIKEIHEYLADEAVLSTGKNPGRYQALLVNQAIGGPVFLLTNQFNQSLIKKRIMMMKKMKTSRMAKLKALLIVPLIALLLLAFMSPQNKSLPFSEGQELTITGNLTDASTGKALPGAVVLIKGTNSGTRTDKDGNYSIDVGDNKAILVYSNTGYKSLEIPVETNTKINVQLDKAEFVVDLSRENNKNNNADPGETNAQVNKNSDKNEKIYVVTEELPGYPGGNEALLKFLESNLRYPAEAKKSGIQGKVMVNFVVTAEGKVTNIKIMRGVTGDLDKEALRLAGLMPDWSPASHDGEPMSMAVTIPIVFKIK
jgi:TonB family protein